MIKREEEHQESTLKMIASENYCSKEIRSVMNSILTDKYAEGFPGHRFYSGCENIDIIEQTAIDYAKMLFGADHAYVQPHSGADANLCAYYAILYKRVILPFLGIRKMEDLTKDEHNQLRELCHSQKLLGLDYSCGGHLTHGYCMNVSSQIFDCYSYGVDKDGFIDYEAVEKKCKILKPLILLAGYSAYPRKINFRIMSEIAHSVGAVLMVDMAHFAGLVAGKVFEGDFDPVKWADVVTSTTHKTLRGIRGGLVLCKEEFKESVDKGCPLVIGGPLPHAIAAKALTFEEALDSSFREYANQIIKNAQVLAETLKKNYIKLLTDGTDNHMVILDLNSLPYALNGKQAEFILGKIGITCNRNAIPNDPNGPWYTSGLRLGVAALTTRGLKEKDMEEVANIISDALKGSKAILLRSGKLSKIQAFNEDEENLKKRVNQIINSFPLKQYF